jgi:hypothetical protein
MLACPTAVWLLSVAKAWAVGALLPLRELLILAVESSLVARALLLLLLLLTVGLAAGAAAGLR